MWKLIVYSRSWRGRWLALENRVRSRLRMIKRKIRKPGDVPTKPDDGVPSVENTRAPRQASREADSMNSMRRNIIAAERTDHVR
jgi:hypothetical protein